MDTPVKIEAVKALVDVVNFDPLEAIELARERCPDCNGSSALNEAIKAEFTIGGDPKPPKEPLYCETCKCEGFVYLPRFNLEKMTQAYRRNVQDVKFDNKGRMILSFRNKDKAQTELMTMLGWDRPDALNRHPTGRAMTGDEIRARDENMIRQIKGMTKEKLMADMLTLSGDQLTSAAERLALQKTIAQLQGYLTTEGATLPDAPEFGQLYAQGIGVPAVIESPPESEV